MELSVFFEAVAAVENLIMEHEEKTRAPAHPYIRSDRVEGTAVYATDGSRIGTIKYLVPGRKGVERYQRVVILRL
jgi:hypothetical protein